MPEYAFDVVTAARVSVRSEDGRRARDALEAAISGATARVIADPPGDGVALTDLRLVASPVLVLVDGVDPSAELRRLLLAHRDRTDGAGEKE